MPLALFDLDNTLLGGDSDYLWGEFLVEQGLVDGESYHRENQRFYADYKAGTLDIYAFLRFSLKPLTEHKLSTLKKLHQRFMAEKIEPIILPAAVDLIERHRCKGHHLLIITATNSFVTQPIADRFGVHELLATDAEIVDNTYTGGVSGVPCFQVGKVTRLEKWLDEQQMDLHDSWFYSDSHNDLPLLERVTHPVAVDPDPTLRRFAAERHWPIISLREPLADANKYDVHQ